jgi:hypothetical protein
MSRTRAQIVDTFSRSLAAEQKILPDVKTVLDQMIDAGMLSEIKDEESKTGKYVLQTTRLGKIALSTFFGAGNCFALQKILESSSELTFLICC